MNKCWHMKWEKKPLSFKRTFCQIRIQQNNNKYVSAWVLNITLTKLTLRSDKCQSTSQQNSSTGYSGGHLSVHLKMTTGTQKSYIYIYIYHSWDWKSSKQEEDKWTTHLDLSLWQNLSERLSRLLLKTQTDRLTSHWLADPVQLKVWWSHGLWEREDRHVLPAQRSRQHHSPQTSGSTSTNIRARRVTWLHTPLHTGRTGKWLWLSRSRVYRTNVTSPSQTWCVKSIPYGRTNKSWYK